MDFILNRRSVREFIDKEITYAELKELCKYGEAAPSARNQQGREYIIVDDRKTILKLSEVSRGTKLLENAPYVIAVIGKAKEQVSTPQMLEQDLACAVENILLAATLKSYGSCYMGIHPIEDRIAMCDDILKVQNGAHTFALIAIGYPLANDVFYEKNKLTDEMIHHNRY